MRLPPGTRLGPYEVVAPLGAGGMGEVYRARDPRLGRDVAVKVVVSGAESDPERLRRFDDEARAAGALNHPNVLAVFDTGRHEGAPYVVFELLEGETLRQRLVRGPLALRKVIEIGGQVCQGLAAALARPAGGEPEPLLFGRDARSLAISRDGRHLAYAQQVVNVNIWRVPLATPTRATAPPAKLISSSRVQQSPAFSHDGRRLAFESARSGAQEIWISNADGSDAVAVTSFNGPATGSPRWSPDGRWIAFDSRAVGHANLYLVGSDGGSPHRVATGQTDNQTPAWSSDGLRGSTSWTLRRTPVQASTSSSSPLGGSTASWTSPAGRYRGSVGKRCRPTDAASSSPRSTT